MTTRVLTPADADGAVDTVILAFASDPMARWTWPAAPEYLVAMAKLTRAFGGRAFEHGSAYGTGDDSGAALWLPPGVGPDEEAIDELIAGTVPPPKIDTVGRIFESMASFHPQEPHWYLPVIGVDPAYQGRGHGAALMRMALDRCDRDHLPAYLESSNPRNITLYRRHGFEPLGEIQLDDAPPVVPMLRPAR